MRLSIVFYALIFTSAAACAQTAGVVKFDRLASAITSTNPEVQVINFWATWCGPCVKELPLFQSLQEKNDGSIKITLVSLDFADKIKTVNSFIQKKKLTSEVILLDEPDYNSWIDRVDASWSGAIPATLIVNSKTGKRKFIEKPIKDGELEQYIAELKQ